MSSDAGVELLADDFVVAKEACRKGVSHQCIHLLVEDKEEVLDMVVDSFVDEDPLYFGSS